MPKDLRQHSMGQLIDNIYHQYRRYFPQLFMISLFFELPQVILSSVIQSRSANNLNWQLLSSGKAGMEQFLTQLQNYITLHGGLTIAVLGLIVTMLNLNVFTPLLNGSFYSLSNDALSSSAVNTFLKITLAHPIQQARKRWPAFLSTLWLLIGLSFAGVIFFGLVALVISLIPGFQFLLVLLYLALLVALLWIVVRLSFTFTSVIIEDKSNWAAIKRSWSLTKYRFWFLFMMLILSQLILSFADMGFNSLVSPLPGIWLQTFLGWIFSIIIQPVYALILVNLFWDFKRDER